METWSGKGQQSDNRGELWERMALRYPLPFDEKTLAETNKVIDLVRSRGVVMQHATVLDIGCGTGIFSLPLAREAGMVTGLDDSPRMLGRMSDVASSHGLKNVRCVKGSWKTIDISEFAFRKAFDIVWVSMSPAVQTRQDFERMEQCARQWCVYIGWGRKRINPLMEEIFNLHELRFGPPPGVGAAYEILRRTGRTPSLDYFETSWDSAESVEDTLEEMVGFVEMHGGRARRDVIEKVLTRHARNGRVPQTTDVEEGLMVWRPE